MYRLRTEAGKEQIEALLQALLPGQDDAGSGSQAEKGAGEMTRWKPQAHPLNRNEILERHDKWRRPSFYCPQCPKRFLTDEAYKAHYKQEHAK